jgi:hypothetical protein
MSDPELLQAVKTQCQAAANAFQRLSGQHPHVPEAQMEFNYAVLLALKGLYEAVEALS